MEKPKKTRTRTRRSRKRTLNVTTEEPSQTPSCSKVKIVGSRGEVTEFLTGESRPDENPSRASETEVDSSSTSTEFQADNNPPVNGSISQSPISTGSAQAEIDPAVSGSISQPPNTSSNAIPTVADDVTEIEEINGSPSTKKVLKQYSIDFKLKIVELAKSSDNRKVAR